MQMKESSLLCRIDKLIRESRLRLIRRAQISRKMRIWAPRSELRAKASHNDDMVKISESVKRVRESYYNADFMEQDMNKRCCHSLG